MDPHVYRVSRDVAQQSFFFHAENLRRLLLDLLNCRLFRGPGLLLLTVNANFC